MLKRFLNRSATVLRDPADREQPYTPVPSQADDLPDGDLERLNALAPWSAFTLDAHGRRVGRAHSQKKRATPQAIPDPRIVELDRRYGLRGRRVLEVGCFEGIHTVALAIHGAQVTAVDGRIENVAKTAIRCALHGVQARIEVWDVERPPPARLDVGCDVLHDVGVLYHLADPVGYLRRQLPQVRQALMLDTHVCAPGSATASYESGGERFDVQPYREGGRADPFSGMQAHARWLPEATLVRVLEQAGFGVDALDRRAERNGPRVLVYAQRRGAAPAYTS